METTPNFSLGDAKQINKMITEKYHADKDYYDKKYTDATKEEKDFYNLGDRKDSGFALWLFSTIVSDVG